MVARPWDPGSGAKISQNQQHVIHINGIVTVDVPDAGPQTPKVGEEVQKIIHINLAIPVNVALDHLALDDDRAAHIAARIAISVPCEHA